MPRDLSGHGKQGAPNVGIKDVVVLSQFDCTQWGAGLDGGISKDHIQSAFFLANNLKQPFKVAKVADIALNGT